MIDTEALEARPVGAAESLECRQRDPQMVRLLSWLSFRILGRSPNTVALRRRLAEYAQVDVPVLLCGERGTGKGLAARVLHHASGRSPKAFVRVACDELSRDGAGPATGRVGIGGRLEAPAGERGLSCQCIEAAQGGTLVLERIEAAPAWLRLDLPRGVGSGLRLVLSASDRLDPRVFEMRSDARVYHRARAREFWIAPLRDRPEDILPIARHELALLSAEQGRPPLELDQQTEAVLRSHAWPGNVGELLAVLRRAVSESGDDRVLDRFAIREAIDHVKASFRPRARFESREREQLRAALDAHAWNVSRTARALGITRSKLRRRIAALHLG